jgi:DNA repair exonuclease SbcCD nuclease subunit
MSKIALIADTHFGVSNSGNFFLNYQEKYFDQLYSDLVKIGISDLFHLGDMYDVRKSINFKTLKKTGEFFVQRFLNAPFNVHVIVGNHDSYNKNSLAINAPRELLGWSEFNIYDYPTELKIDGENIAIIPWICSENAEECFDFLDDTMANICFGHFDIAGFSMNKDIVNRAGISRTVFSKFKKTFSGHFHLPSSQDNIIYVGSPYQMSWTDYGDTKRVIIYDTKTGEISFLYNYDTIFEKIYFTNESELNILYTDKIVKVYASGNYDSYKLDLFISALNKQDPQSVNVIETVNFEDVDEQSDAAQKDTMEFLVEYVDKIDFSDEDRSYTKELLLEYYNRAQEV